jgi:hypothetical protein
MRFFVDTEFMEDGTVIELLSIGIVTEDGDTFYRENREADWGHANDWVKGNVLPHLKGASESYVWVSRERLAQDLRNWVLSQCPSSEPIEFWGYFADYDWVVLCQLFGKMVDLPNGFPMFCMDLKQFAQMLGVPRKDFPSQDSAEHYALNDAVWNLDLFTFLKREMTRLYGTVLSREFLRSGSHRV